MGAVVAGPEVLDLESRLAGEAGVGVAHVGMLVPFELGHLTARSDLGRAERPQRLVGHDQLASRLEHPVGLAVRFEEVLAVIVVQGLARPHVTESGVGEGQVEHRSQHPLEEDALVLELPLGCLESLHLVLGDVERGNVEAALGEHRRRPAGIRAEVDAPPSAHRGAHAHREVLEVIAAAAGSLTVDCDDEDSITEVSLQAPSAALLLPALVWLEVRNFSPGAVCLVMASGPYRAEDLRTLEGLPWMELPAPRAGSLPAWHQFVVRVERRDAVRAELLARGVQTLVHYPEPPHRSAAYAGATTTPLPVTDRLAQRVLSLPVGPHVDDRAGARICEALSEAVGRSI
jgi:WxcM-like, C-terminal/DegT/DnrJ/EryC1/StrS aminotransferase family